MRRIFGFATLALVVALAQAQPLTVLSPPDRFVRPGDVVTLGFELVSPERIDVDIEATSSSDWPFVVEPTTLTLEPQLATPVTVTVEVPPFAPALSSDRITLRITGIDVVVERTVELGVVEVVDLRLEAPAQAALTEEGLVVAVENAGNNPDEVTLELLRDDEVLDLQVLTLAPGVREELRFDLADEGPHTLLLTSARGVVIERAVRVLLFGTPEPDPFRLTGALTAAYGLHDDWQGTLTLRGRLSDFSALDLRVDAPSWRRSFAAVSLEHGIARVGAAGSAPFRLDLPRDFGISATYERDGIGAATMIGATANDLLSATVAGSWTAPGYSLAAGVGVREGRPLAALRATYSRARVALALTGRYRDEAINARLTADLRGEASVTNLRTNARDILKPRARLEFGVRHRTGPTTVYGDVTAPLGESAAWNWRAGFTQDITTDLPGTLQLTLEAGSTATFARLTHRAVLADTWRASNEFGVRHDSTGFGINLASAWTFLGGEDFSFDTRLAYYPGPGRLEGQLRMRYQLVEDPLSLALGATWNLTEPSLGFSSAFGVREGRWQFDIDGSVRYAYAKTTDPWTVELGVSLTYTFETTVPTAVVDQTGGRRLGTLAGSVRVEGQPLADVVVEVGPYRALTDATGRFELMLPPRSYLVRVDETTVPAGYRILEPSELTVEVEARMTTEVEFAVARTTP